MLKNRKKKKKCSKEFVTIPKIRFAIDSQLLGIIDWVKWGEEECATSLTPLAKSARPETRVIRVNALLSILVHTTVKLRVFRRSRLETNIFDRDGLFTITYLF